MNKDSYTFIGLFLVFFAGMGLLASILFEKNIPLSIVIGAVIGIIIGSITDLLIRNRKEQKEEQ